MSASSVENVAAKVNVVLADHTAGQGKQRHRSREYIAWSNMVQRCTNPNSSSYAMYGARGVKVCGRWLKSFCDFVADVGLSPSSIHQIDRIKVSGNYEPGNVKWSTPKEQARNRRTSRLLTHNGETKTIAEWAEVSGVPYKTLFARLVYCKWPAEKALIPAIVAK